MESKKVAIVTGASNGIGKAIAIDLSLNGFSTTIVGRNTKKLNILLKELRSYNNNPFAITANINNTSDIEKIVSSVIEKYGKIDCLINCAGLGYFNKIEEIDNSEWDALMDTNLKSIFMLSKQVIPYMKKNKLGHIVNIASDASRRVFEDGTLYCASKYALDGFSMALRKELREYGIKISVIYPGITDTEFNINHKDYHNESKNWLTPEDVAKTITFVLSMRDNVVIDELMIHPLNQAY